MKKINLDGTEVNQESLPYVIAEIGHNHQGSLENCKQLFIRAKEAGANAVKLQKRDNKKLYTKTFYNSIYDNRHSYGETYGQHREFLEFGISEYKELFALAKELNITFFATPFDIPSLEFLEKLGCPFYKVASSDITFIQLIKKINETKKPIIISTGFSTFEDIDRIKNNVNFQNDVAFLHCVSSYPAEPQEVNLRVIEEMNKKYENNIIGYSSHDSGLLISWTSYLFGSRIVEKHFTISRSLKGTDHGMSLEPDGLMKLVNGFKKMKLSIGNTNMKKKLNSEFKPMTKMKKSIVASTDLLKGNIIKKEDLEFKSPGGGLECYQDELLLGKKLTCDINKDQFIVLSNVE
jgi:sialic acid synthase